MSNTQTQGIPGMDAMNDTLAFVKNLWGNMGTMGMSGMKIPGMIMPTLSVEEIDKQIADLKTVESWLTLNMNMLRSTIQALEVQSATISALQAMGDSLSAAVKPAPPAAKAEAPVKAPRPEPEPESVKEAAKPQAKQQSQPTGKAEAAAQMPNPAMWWNMLQDQFKQAVGTAMAAEPAAPAKSATEMPKKAAPKTAARRTKTPAPKAAKTAKGSKAT
ncbi:MAG TPA: PhaM family polyhydroxyalkanoate granule multifunctional regulatory protein [Burkholderiaceae bacterium]